MPALPREGVLERMHRIELTEPLGQKQPRSGLRGRLEAEMGPRKAGC